MRGLIISAALLVAVPLCAQSSSNRYSYSDNAYTPGNITTPKIQLGSDIQPSVISVAPVVVDERVPAYLPNPGSATPFPPAPNCSPPATSTTSYRRWRRLFPEVWKTPRSASAITPGSSAPRSTTNLPRMPWPTRRKQNSSPRLLQTYFVSFAYSLLIGPRSAHRSSPACVQATEYRSKASNLEKLLNEHPTVQRDFPWQFASM